MLVILSLSKDESTIAIASDSRERGNLMFRFPMNSPSASGGFHSFAMT